MDAWRELIQGEAALWLAWGGFAIGALFGLVAQQTNFCTMGALSDLQAFGDARRLRAWALAIAVAVLGTQTLGALGVVELGLSMYRTANLHWLGHLAGGLLFGIGMVFAGGCASRNLVRAGGGDLRALVVLLVIGTSAYMTLGGILGPARAWLEAHTSLSLAADQSIPALLASFGAGDASTLVWPSTLVIAAALLFYCFKDAAFRTAPRHVLGGLGVGLCVIAGWALTGLAYDEFAAVPRAPISLTYVRPSGDTLEYLERYTAARVPGFGVATVFGALAGAWLGALLAGRFKWVGFADSGDTVRNLVGAMMMGVGGILALGCTIGQGVTGVATLALGSWLTLGGILAGGVLGLRWLERLLDV